MIFVIFIGLEVMGFKYEFCDLKFLMILLIFLLSCLFNVSIADVALCLVSSISIWKIFIIKLIVSLILL
jgi:hypothetical protein